MGSVSRFGLVLALIVAPALLAGCGCDGANFAWDPIDLELDDDDSFPEPTPTPEPDDDDSAIPIDDDDSAEPEWDEGTCGYDLGATQCFGQDFAVCEAGDGGGAFEWQLVETCEGETPICHDELGCLVCEPGTTVCDGPTVLECAEDGGGW